MDIQAGQAEGALIDPLLGAPADAATPDDEGVGVGATDEPQPRLASTWDATRSVLYQHRHKIVLGAMVWLWFMTFFRLGALRHDRFATFGFDLGIFDQAAWLVAHFRDPFMTVRGLDVWGHHGNFVFYLFAPFYWLGAGPKFLLAVQLVGQLAGAVGIYLLARDRMKGERWIAVLLAGAMLAHPTMQFLAWEYFHPETLAIGPMILAYWAARVGRWKLFWVMAVLAMSCKEDITFFFMVLGVVLMFRKQVRIGAWVTGVAVAWYLAVTQLLIPWRNPAGPFYEEHFFSNYGGSVPNVLKNIVTNPTKVWRDLTASNRVDFYVKLWAPVAFLPFLSPQTLVLAVPTLGIVVLASIPWVQDYRYHYMAIPLAVTFLATVEAIAWIRSRERRLFAAGAVLAASIFGTALWGVSPISRQWDDGYWPRRYSEGYLEILFGVEGDDSTWPQVAAKQRAIDLVPDDASVSASYSIVPHVSGRTHAYEWPNPWIGTNWGICNDRLDDPAGVEWLIVDRRLFGDTSQPALLERLVESGEFEVRADSDDVVVAQRVRPPSGPPPAVITECG